MDRRDLWPLGAIGFILVVTVAWWTLALLSVPGAPEWLDEAELRDALVADVPAVRDVHHGHAWMLTVERPLITLHAQVDAGMAQVLRIVGIGYFVVADLVPLLFKCPGEPSHSVKECHDFLDMVLGIVRFLPHFCHQVDYIFALTGKPTMPCIELVPKDKPECSHSAESFGNRLGCVQVLRNRPSVSYLSACNLGLNTRFLGSLPTPLLFGWEASYWSVSAGRPAGIFGHRCCTSSTCCPCQG